MSRLGLSMKPKNSCLAMQTCRDSYLSTYLQRTAFSTPCIFVEQTLSEFSGSAAALFQFQVDDIGLEPAQVHRGISGRDLHSGDAEACHAGR